MRPLFRLFGTLQRHRARLSLGLLATAVAVAATLLLPYLLGQAVDAIDARNHGRLVGVGLLTLGIGAAGALATGLRTLIIGRVSWEIEQELRYRVHDRALASEASFVHGLGTGQLLSRAMVGAREVGYFLGYGLGALATAVLTAVAALVAMLVLHPLLTLVALAPLPFVALATHAYDRRGTPAMQEALQRVGEVGSEAQENIAGALTIRALAREHQRERRFERAVHSLFGQQLRVIRIKARYQPLIQFLAALMYVAVLAYGADLAVRGEISAGRFVAFYAYLTVLLVPLNTLGGLLAVAQTAAAAARRVLEVLDHTPAVHAVPGAPDLPDGSGAIRLAGCDSGILKEIDLQVAGGGSLAVVGGSGAGKSTLLRLIYRAEDPVSGSVAIDGADLREVTLASLHRAVAVVSDDPFLFAASVRENLAFGRPDATDEELEDAARMAEAHEFIAALPDGYETEVGERGTTLSGGQRQRLVLARALVAAPRVLVLDDPTTSLDPQTERRVVDALLRTMERLTTVVVTSRPELLAAADEVVLLDDGRVIGRGTHEQLHASSEQYRDVVDGAAGAERANTEDAAAPEADHAPDASLPEVEPPAHPRPIRAVLSLLRPYRARTLLAAGVVAAVSVLLLVPPYLAGRAVDDVILPADRSSLALIVGIYAGVTVLVAVTSALQIYLVEWVGSRGLADLRVAVIRRLLELPMSFYDSQQTGRLVSRLTNDVESMEGALSNGVVTLLSSLVALIGPLVLMVAVDADLALLAFATFPVIAVAVALFRRSASSAYAGVRVVVASLTARLHESLAGLEVIQSFHQHERRRRELEAAGEETIRAKMRTTRLSAAYLGGIELYVVGSLVFVELYGGNQVLNGAVQLGSLVTFTLYLQQFLASSQALSTLAPLYQSARAALDHVLGLLATPSDLVDRPGAQPLPAGPGEVRFRSVGAAYAPGRWVLRDVDLTVAPGETVALVGHTGAGKSTLAQLLPRIYDVAEGAVLIDDHDVRDVTLHSLRRQVGLVPQEGFLFHGSVADNLRLASTDATDAELAAAAATVGLDSAGVELSAHVSEGGSNLSSGQRQLVALARLLVYDPRIVILDEATSHLDLRRQDRAEGALARALHGRTVLVVAHRASTVRRADRVIVFEQGRVVEAGHPDELAARSGGYSLLFGRSGAA